MPRHEAYRLGMITMGQRNTGIGRAATGRGNPGDDLERYVVRRQFFDLFAASPEYERIAAFEPQYALAFFSQGNQQLVDLILRHRMRCALFTDIDAIGIAPAQVEDSGRYQAVVQDHVGLLHQAQGTEGQQIRIARSGTDQIDLAQGFRLRTRQFFRQEPLGLLRLTSERTLRDAALEDFFPEHTPLLYVCKFGLDLAAEFLRQACQFAIDRWHPGLDARSHEARQHGSITTAGNSDHQRRAIDNGWKNHRTQLRRIHHVDRHAKRLGVFGYLLIQRLVIGRSDRQHAA